MKCTLLLLSMLVSTCQIFAQQETIESLTRKPANREISKPLVDLKTKELIQKAINRIPENYPDKPHLMEGFYRKVSTYQNEYTHLLEAAFLMEDSSYTTKATSTPKVKLLQLRQSTEWGNIDSTAIKKAAKYVANGMAKFPNITRASKNAVHRTYEYNLLRVYNTPHTVFNSKGGFVENITFRITDISLIENNTIFHIVIGDMNMPEGTSYLKINSSDFAIVEYQRGFYFGYDLADQVLVRCKKVEGRYYPEFIKVIVPSTINNDVGGHQVDIHTLWVNSVETSKFNKIKRKEKIDRMQELQVLSLPYHEAFWADYFMLKFYPLETEIRYSLEKGKSLERQFKENAAQ